MEQRTKEGKYIERRVDKERAAKTERDREREGGNAGHNYKIIILRTLRDLAARHLE